ncbi:MAG: hypothetical protein KBF19_06195 [Negativicutes bacterium]|nr:hypothetical protein [Negativicutes bacterium]
MKNKFILAIDPGKEKTGIAILNQSGEVASRLALSNANLKDQLALLDQEFQPIAWVVGSKNAGREIRDLAERLNQRNVPFYLQNEHRSSEEGRLLYWQANPPTGFMRFIPSSFQVPSEPWDDWAAVVIGRRWIAKNCD